ncbi:hypothetical protein BDV95DRAFT_612410 [Massariosphaeria phaeospora]|uniref:Fungal N-terminal domain-containing protein n=1 Tax=Massariosphaeria phaeospora TaxID=100035 RepID=A0A7C8M1C2_9PLEO|nr:hypothetical protein BDV95DRAFT_612410 [Massariosphaeria phaeospora]
MTSILIPHGENILSALEKLDHQNDKIVSHYRDLSKLLHCAETPRPAFQREATGIQLRRAISKLEHEIVKHREITNGITLQDMAEVYRVAGRTHEEACLEATNDINALERGLQQVEETLGEVKATLKCAGGELGE